VWPSCTVLTTVICLHALIVLGVSPVRQPDVAPFCSAVLIVAAFVYGLFRVREFHPIFTPPYCEWLATTPWTPAKPLPIGPVHLVGADVVLLAAAVAAAWPFSGAEAALTIVKVFLATYSVMLMAALFRTREWFAGYAMWFGLGMMVLRWTVDAQFFVTAAVMYGIGMIGFRRSLGRFPLDSPGRIPTPPPGVTPITIAMPGGIVKMFYGWPFGYLWPQGSGVLLSRTHGTIISLLAGWTVYSVCSLVPVETATLGSVPLLVIFGYVTLFRLGAYGIVENRPPISLAGRLATGRWIIPQYDSVFVAPLATIMVALSGGSLMDHWGVPGAAGIAAVVSLCFLILLTFGPDHQRWLLTAPIRFVPTVAVRRKTHWA
jgi:hypothetical protein